MNSDHIIAIETSGRRGSAALAVGPRVIAEREFPPQHEHAGELIPTLDDLRRAVGWRHGDIQQCYLSIGPGSFTGLRVAVAFARHLAFATGARIIAVPTLEVIAENCADLPDPPAHLAVILDAKQGQVFAALFERAATGYQLRDGPRMVEPTRWLGGLPTAPAVCGEGLDYHREAIDASGAAIVDRALWWPRAVIVHRLGWRRAQSGMFTPARELVPLYIRRPEVEEVWEKRHRPSSAHDVGMQND